MSTIEIYTNKNCKYCKQIKEELTNKNIDFVNKDTSEFKEEWGKIVNLTSLPTVPTIFYKNSYFVANRDFNNPQTVIDIIENFEELKIDNSVKCLEQLKTLNFNIATAFNRLEKVINLNNINNEHKSTD